MWWQIVPITTFTSLHTIPQKKKKNCILLFSFLFFSTIHKFEEHKSQTYQNKTEKFKKKKKKAKKNDGLYLEDATLVTSWFVILHSMPFIILTKLYNP